MKRRVDQAMEEDRPEKITIRKLWVDLVEVEQLNYERTDQPLYLTLSGAEGKDIAALCARGVLRTTEVGAVVPEDQNKIVAVEANAPAVLALQRKFPGLKIVESRIESLLRSPNLM